ncbi:30S ribosomal protein S2 [Candidatus Woesearchaeota archaeon]|jgi:small subunit ribosomal protein S2|nr:30S ribosomal protein S2 [Candidatus Woesearchaeota archaeon]MBT6044431.1 30S ribosomal protein S2 [Candidatus Woesearchaeota archaeon]
MVTEKTAKKVEAPVEEAVKKTTTKKVTKVVKKAVKKVEVKEESKVEEKPAEVKEVSEKVKEEKPKNDDSNLMVPLDNYLKAGLHIGTKFRTKFMEKFIYKVRTDGLTVLNVQAIDERIRVVADFITKYAPEDIVVVGKRENGWRAIKLFAKVTGIKAYAGRYHPGILTNPNLEDFHEAKLIIVADPWPDKDALRDAAKVGAVTVALCDTNNDSTYVDLVLPCNNKGRKSLGLVFWILAREYMKTKFPELPETTYTLDDFMGENEPRPEIKRRKFIPRRRN